MFLYAECYRPGPFWQLLLIVLGSFIMKKEIICFTLLILSPFTFGQENLTLSDKDIENVISAYQHVQLSPDFYDNSVKPGETYHIPTQQEVMEMLLGQFDYRKVNQEFLSLYNADTNPVSRLLRSQLDYSGFDNIEQFAMAYSVIFSVSALLIMEKQQPGGIWNSLLDRAKSLQNDIPKTTIAAVARNLDTIIDFLDMQDAKYDRILEHER